MDNETKNIIENHIKNNEVCLFMKGTPDAPQCGFSMVVTNMLKLLEVNFHSVNVLEDQNIREGIKVYSDWPTIPQLYVKNEIENNDVCLFMKGTPDAPQCGFSMAVNNILKILEVNFKSINVLENQNIREGIKVYSDWPTIPQLYVKNEFIGGCDIIKEMYDNGELIKLLENKNIAFKKNN